MSDLRRSGHLSDAAGQTVRDKSILWHRFLLYSLLYNFIYTNLHTLLYTQYCLQEKKKKTNATKVFSGTDSFWEQIKMKLHNSAGIWRLSENTNTRTVEKANLQQMDECGVKVNSSWALAISRRSCDESISKKEIEERTKKIRTKKLKRNFFWA